jgi:hypothetical protein
VTTYRFELHDPGDNWRTDETPGAWYRRVAANDVDPPVTLHIEVESETWVSAWIEVGYGTFTAIHRYDLSGDRPVTRPPDYVAADGTPYAPSSREAKRATYERVRDQVRLLLASFYAQGDLKWWCQQATVTDANAGSEAGDPPVWEAVPITDRHRFRAWKVDEAPRSRRGRKSTDTLGEDDHERAQDREDRISRDNEAPTAGKHRATGYGPTVRAAQTKRRKRRSQY